MTAISAGREGDDVHRKRPNRSVRATLNALAALVDYTARIVIQLVLAPLMLNFLGAAGYGVWQVLQRLIGHATPAGGRPGEALKWVVAQTQTSDDDERKRRQVGTAIVVWALFIPFTAVLGAVLAWFAPALVHAQPDQVWTVRAAAGLLVVNLIVLGLAGVPQSVLQGENLGYRRLGLSTAILFVGALLMLATLWAGWGVVGLFSLPDMPMALREKIAADVKEIMDNDPIIKDRLILTAQIPNPGGPAEFAKSIEEQKGILAKAAKDLGIKGATN